LASLSAHLSAAKVEALVELAAASLAAADEGRSERARLVVHVDAVALTSAGGGRSEHSSRA
jgi:hypothetical protein